jgi:hypothetical protein
LLIGRDRARELPIVHPKIKIVIETCLE